MLFNDTSNALLRQQEVIVSFVSQQQEVFTFFCFCIVISKTSTKCYHLSRYCYKMFTESTTESRCCKGNIKEVGSILWTWRRTHLKHQRVCCRESWKCTENSLWSWKSLWGDNLVNTTTLFSHLFGSMHDHTCLFQEIAKQEEGKLMEKISEMLVAASARKSEIVSAILSICKKVSMVSM